jgi:hypothetical protein
MKTLLVLAFLGMIFNVKAAQRVEELEQYEIRSYNPIDVGVKDLVYEIRVEGLKDIIEKNLVVGKLSDLYFKIYWLNPSEFRIEVMGLPKGFIEVKNDLKELIKGKLDFVIPEKFSERLKPYSLKIEPIADGKLMKAIDETYTLAVPEIYITFDKSGRLKLIESKMSMTAIKTEFFHSTKSWSNNKLVLDRIISNSNSQGVKYTIINDLQYSNVNGFGLPSKLVVKNITEYTIPETAKEKAKQQKKETNSVIFFSKFEINSGKAQRFITEGQLK